MPYDLVMVLERRNDCRRLRDHDDDDLFEVAVCPTCCRSRLCPVCYVLSDNPLATDISSASHTITNRYLTDNRRRLGDVERVTAECIPVLCRIFASGQELGCFHIGSRGSPAEFGL